MGSGANSYLNARKVGRASRTFAQLWQVPTFFLGLLALLAVAATTPLRKDSTQQEFDDAIEQLRSALLNRQVKIGPAQPVVEDLLSRAAFMPRKAGQIEFLAGWFYQRLAEESPAERAVMLNQKALDHLEAAMSQKVSEEDRPVLLYRLGAALYRKGSDPERAIDFLTKGVEAGSDQPAQGYGMLVKLHLARPKVDLDAALAANQKQMLFTEDDSELLKARLVRGDLLVRMGKRLEALKELEPIGPQAPRDIRLKARHLQTQCCEAEGLWSRAIPYYKELHAELGDLPGQKSRLLFQLGRCYSKSDPPQISEAETAWRETIKAGGQEGQAAGLFLSEQSLTAGQGKAESALTELTTALQNVSRPVEFKNTLVSLADAQKILHRIWNEFQERKDFASAEQVGMLYRRISDHGIAEECLAKTRQAWAKDIETKAAKGTAVEIEQAKPKAHEQYLRAGQAYEQAADARPLDEQPALLWKSAQCYRLAQDLPLSISLVRRFVQINNSEEALAEAWLTLATMLQTVGQKDQAREAFHKCIEFPNTPFAYRARYQLALDSIDEGNLDQAENILRQNLTVTGPSIDRDAHGNSLYKIAKLLLERKSYDQAGLMLKEAVRQYPSDPKSWAARDQLGHCYRQLAEDVDTKLKGTLTPDSKRHWTSSRRTLLDEASKIYQALADDLEKKAAQAPLGAEEEILCRKATFAVADVCKDLNEFSEALRRYRTLLDKHRGELEGLLACQRIWSCASIMYVTPEHAKSALEAARDAVQKTTADVEMMGSQHAAFKGPDRTSHEDWQRWLRRASERLEALANPPPTRSPVLQ